MKFQEELYFPKLYAACYANYALAQPELAI